MGQKSYIETYPLTKNMIKSLIYISIFVMLFSSGCGNDKNNPLDEAITEIESSFSETQLKEFAQKEERIAIMDTRFGYGLKFRNQELQNPSDSSLIKYFHSNNIYDLEDMSGIVFRSFHRKLNGRPIDFEAQLNSIHAYWAKVEECKSRNTTRALGYYNKYHLTDTIMVRMPIDERRNAIQYVCPDTTDWVYDDNNDMLIKGIIMNKNYTKDTLDIFFKLKILSRNNDSIPILYEDVNKGDIIDIDLKYDIIEDVN